MKYFFTWDCEFLIREAQTKWKNQFIQKYWDFNLIEIENINYYDNNFLAENILSWSFLAEKKLIIIEINKSIDEEKLIFLEKNIENTSDETIILVSLYNPDKRSKLYKFLKNKFEIKEFNLKSEVDLINFIKTKYKDKIDLNAIDLIIKYKWSNLQKIIQEIDKLLIINSFITKNEIINNIEPELEESIFIILDDILNLRINQSITKINNLLNYTNVYAFYNNLLANMRINTFISKLKTSWVNQNQISDLLNLWKRSFLVNKNYKINSEKLIWLYLDLIEIDKNMKSWKLLWSDERDIFLEIEKSLIETIK